MNTHSENDIAKVLTGLRDTQPAANLEQRILHGIQHRTPARTPLLLRWQLIAAIPAAALAIFVAAHFFSPNHFVPSYTASATTPTIAPGTTTTPGRPSTAAGVPFFAHFAKGGVSSEARPLSPAPTPTLSSRPEGSAVERPAVFQPATLSPADRQALEDANAPSQPPPPLPLSRDERILLAAAQRGHSVEVAQLDSLPENPLRAANAARETATVQLAVQRLIKQLAAAETLNPTPPAAEPNDLPAPTDASSPN